MFFHFDRTTYARMLRLARAERSAARRRQLYVILLVVIPVVSTLHALCFFLDYVFFPGLRNVDVRTPVFIVGQARSGTKLLHRLMSNDTERFSYFLLYELFLPSLIEKKLVRLIRALAAQINSLAERIGVEQEVAMVGGGARDGGLVQALREIRGHDILVPQRPHMTAALGAALIAMENLQQPD